MTSPTDEAAIESAALDDSAAPYEPTLRDMIMLTVPTGVTLSPNGRRLAFTVQSTNWKENRYETHGYVHDVTTGETRRLTRTGSVSRMEWVDDETLAVLKNGSGNGKMQIWLYEGLVGEGRQITDHESGVDWFKPFAEGVLFSAADPEREKKKERKDRFGTFTHFEQEESAAALYYTEPAALEAYEAKVRAATEDEAKTLVKPVVELSRLLESSPAIRQVVPAPTGDAIYLACWPYDDLVYYRDTSAYRIALDPSEALDEYVRREEAEKEQAKKGEAKEKEDEKKDESKDEKKDASYLGDIVRLNVPRATYVTAVSPDGDKLLIGHQGRDEKMYTREDIWVIDVKSAIEAPDADTFKAAMDNVTASLDRQILDRHWVEHGIFGTYVDGTKIRIARFTEAGEVVPVDLGEVHSDVAFDISDGGDLALIGMNETSFPEVYIAHSADGDARWRVERVTEFGDAVEGWASGTVETIRWESRDGTMIEGVLRKPADFNPNKRYPLVLMVHGGPSWFSAAYAFPAEERKYYPAVQFLNKDVLVLKPNYRGSVGRGQVFMELNVDNLGVGDLWDIESGVEHLVELGWVDPELVGCMGWSQGGYISAFAGLHSTMFKAVSVGAGISDWYTYHISNDIPDFTVDYLSGSPFRSREVYEKTAPMSNITHAETPMLIQHGSEDRRVPLSNGMELYRGLKEMGVDVELFVFPGMGHPITKPRENHAVMQQNLTWFGHYLLGEELELP